MTISPSEADTKHLFDSIYQNLSVIVYADSLRELIAECEKILTELHSDKPTAYKELYYNLLVEESKLKQVPKNKQQVAFNSSNFREAISKLQLILKKLKTKLSEEVIIKKIRKKMNIKQPLPVEYIKLVIL